MLSLAVAAPIMLTQQTRRAAQRLMRQQEAEATAEATGGAPVRPPLHPNTMHLGRAV